MATLCDRFVVLYIVYVCCIKSLQMPEQCQHWSNWIIEQADQGLNDNTRPLFACRLHNSRELNVVGMRTLVVESWYSSVCYVLLVVSWLFKRLYLHVKNMIVSAWNVNGFLVVFGHPGPQRFRLKWPDGYTCFTVVVIHISEITSRKRIVNWQCCD